MQTMKNVLIFSFLFIVSGAFAQGQVEIEHDSDSSSPQLTLTEIDGTGGDGWVRLFFQNTIDPTSKWGLLGRPQTGTTDNTGDLVEPFIITHNGDQKFGISSDGYVRINKKYTLPNDNSLLPGMSLVDDGNGNVEWDFSTARDAFKLIDSNDNSSMFFKENITAGQSDSLYLQINDGSSTVNMMKASVGLIDIFERMRISSAGLVSSPQLDLVDELKNNFTRLQFGNEESTTEWRLQTRAFQNDLPINTFDILYDAGGGMTKIFLKIDGDNNLMELNAATTEASGNVQPDGHKTRDLGADGIAWDNVYADDYINQGAASFHDINITEELVKYIPSPKKPGSFDYQTEKGLVELDPNSCPEYLTEGNGLLIDEMTTYNYKANYEQQLQMNMQQEKIEQLEKELNAMKVLMNQLLQEKK